MNSKINEAILKTLCYADVFDYPLTVDEIGKWLIKFKIQSSKIKITIKNLKLIETIEGYYFLRGRENIVKERIKRKAWSEEKIKVARKAANILRFIPTIQLVGVTGALAMDNAKRDDDIDLFIISSRGLLWTTRLLSVFAVEITGKRRHPDDSEVNNKICLNMFMDENHLTIPKNERDLFSAHEVVQIKPIVNKYNTYEKFLIANRWVKNYLPNAFGNELRIMNYELRNKNKDKSLLRYYIVKLLNYVEVLLKNFQLWYMRDRRTTEVIKKGLVRFHPKDARIWVMEKYKERLSKLKLV